MDFRIESNEKEQLEESIIRQLSTLYKTRRGSIPMHRDFGLLWDILAESTPIFQNRFTVEVVTQTEKYVPEKEVRWEFLTVIQRLILLKA